MHVRGKWKWLWFEKWFISGQSRAKNGPKKVWSNLLAGNIHANARCNQSLSALEEKGIDVGTPVLPHRRFISANPTFSYDPFSQNIETSNMDSISVPGCICILTKAPISDAFHTIFLRLRWYCEDPLPTKTDKEEPAFGRLQCSMAGKMQLI